MIENKQEQVNDVEINSGKVEPLIGMQSLQDLSSNNFLLWFGFVIIAFFVSIFLCFKGPSSDNIQASLLFTLLFAFCAFFGAVFSLIFSKQLAIKAHKMELIDPENPKKTELEEQLFNMVIELATKAGLTSCPMVGIYESPDMNAFATGKSPNDSLIAFSTGILEAMPLNELRAVAAHEIGHIANKDMLGTILIQGFLNAIVICATFPLHIVRLIAQIAFSGQGLIASLLDGIIFICAILTKIVLNFFGMLGALAFSRHREYKADKFASILVSAEDMLSALTRLSTDTATAPIEQSEYASFKVSGKITVAELFSTHPPIEKRMKALAGNITTDTLHNK